MECSITSLIGLSVIIGDLKVSSRNSEKIINHPMLKKLDRYRLSSLLGLAGKRTSLSRLTLRPPLWSFSFLDNFRWARWPCWPRRTGGVTTSGGSSRSFPFPLSKLPRRTAEGWNHRRRFMYEITWIYNVSFELSQFKMTMQELAQESWEMYLGMLPPCPIHDKKGRYLVYFYWW